LSRGLRPAALKEELLRECCMEASETAAADPAARAAVANIGRRYLAVLRYRHLDPCPFILTIAADCFKGKLPLSLLSDLLESFHGSQRSTWNLTDLHRLPILLADCAFSADVDVDDWLSLGRAFPVLNDVLSLELRWHWRQVHALWSKRDERPWDKIGQAETMLELADNPADHAELLAYYPDVLLYAELPNIALGTRGVWIEGNCVTSFAPGTEVSAEYASGGYELQIGGYQRIPLSENPDAYLDDIRSWLRYYFQDFVPSVPNTPQPMTESRHRMWQLSKVPCPECQRSLVPCPGDLGLPVR
jgi:hypothetical protein